MIRTRFAPSPTGNLHIGGLRTALYSYALAKHAKGEFVLRIEDTDRKRYVEGTEEKIYRILTDFGLKWNEGPKVEGPHSPYIQSQRVQTGIYQNAAQRLVEKGHAFYCQCSPRNAKEKGFSSVLRDPCRAKNLKEGAIKLLVPDGEIVSYKDFVLDRVIHWVTSEVPDTTLLKSDGFPTYHLAVVVDDNDMKISHVLRGHDWLPSTPVHLLLYKYLWLQEPEIGHLTDILDPEGGKLSKRKGSTSVDGLLAEGYLPEAILNFIMLLGWAPKDNREIFSLSEFVDAFDPEGLQKSNPVFNKEKLRWFNNYYYQQKSLESPSRLATFIGTASQYAGEPDFKDIVSGTAQQIAPRASNIFEYDDYLRPFYIKPPLSNLPLGNDYKKHLRVAYEVLNSLKNWQKEKIENPLLGAVKENKFNTGDFFMDLRVALTGSRTTMPITDFIAYFVKIFGEKKLLKRLKDLL